MLRFLKLTDCFINPKCIKIIKFEPNLYLIKLINDNKGFFVYGIGPLNMPSSTIKVCKNEHPEDYKIVTDWIEDSKHK